MIAYYAQSRFGLSAVMVFAAGDVEALPLAIAALSPDEVAHLQRQPEFDDCAPGPVTDLQMIERGWAVECAACGNFVGREIEERVHTEEHTYCNEACRERGESDE